VYIFASVPLRSASPRLRYTSADLITLFHSRGVLCVYSPRWSVDEAKPSVAEPRRKRHYAVKISLHNVSRSIMALYIM